MPIETERYEKYIRKMVRMGYKYIFEEFTKHHGILIPVFTSGSGWRMGYISIVNIGTKDSPTLKFGWSSLNSKEMHTTQFNPRFGKFIAMLRALYEVTDLDEISNNVILDYQDAIGHLEDEVTIGGDFDKRYTRTIFDSQARILKYYYPKVCENIYVNSGILKNE